jgi:transcriptional regulator with XRE-family HTH domain
MRRARIHDLMDREGIKDYTQLAARVGVHYSTVSLWARDKVAPSEALRERVCKAFDGRYSEDWLFPRVVAEPEAVAV